MQARPRTSSSAAGRWRARAARRRSASGSPGTTSTRTTLTPQSSTTSGALGMQGGRAGVPRWRPGFEALSCASRSPAFCRRPLPRLPHPIFQPWCGASLAWRRRGIVPACASAAPCAAAACTSHPHSPSWHASPLWHPCSPCAVARGWRRCGTPRTCSARCPRTRIMRVILWSWLMRSSWGSTPRSTAGWGTSAAHQVGGAACLSRPSWCYVLCLLWCHLNTHRVPRPPSL